MPYLDEYQGKQLLKEYGIKIPEGEIAITPEEAFETFERLNRAVVLKAQVLTGGRGLAGGIKFSATADGVRKKAAQLLQMKIKGQPVEKLLVEERLNIKKEFYLSIILDRTTKKPVLLGTNQGGVNIDKLGEENPELISRVVINPLTGVYNYHGIELFCKFKLPVELHLLLASLVPRLYRLFTQREAFMLEINPLVLTEELEIVAADCKLIVDPAASYLKKDLSPRYIPLEGDIGVLANGAGLTMMTMDVLKEYGLNPANFLEIGGEYYKRAGEALEYLLKKRNDLKGLLVNLFGAYARTDVIIRQVVDVIKENKLDLPISFRIRGTGEERAKEFVEKELHKKVYPNLGEAIEELLGLLQE